MTTQLLAGNPKQAVQNPTWPFIELLLAGVVMQVIYVTYIIAFPLISNTQAGGPAADLEILMRDYRWFAPIYAAGIVILYYLFWRMMQTVARIAPHVRYTNPLAKSTTKPEPLHYMSAHTIHRLKLFILIFGFLFNLFNLVAIF